MYPERKSKVLIPLSALAVLAVAAWAYALPSGPSVTGGKNPLVSLHSKHELTVKTNSGQNYWAVVKTKLYEVPAGRMLVLRELVRSPVPVAAAPGLAPSITNANKPCTLSYTCILADGVIRYCGKALALETGIRFDAGTKLEIQTQASSLGYAGNPEEHKCASLITVNGLLLRP